MLSGSLSIDELAEQAGLSRRAIRFYVQQKLLPVPLGRGRGRHYDASHLERLRQIMALQRAGHSLEAIRRILQRGGEVPAPPPAAVPSRLQRRTTLRAELWTRVRIGEGVELHFDASRHQPTIERLLALREAVRAAFGSEENESGASDGSTPEAM